MRNNGRQYISLLNCINPSLQSNCKTNKIEVRNKMNVTQIIHQKEDCLNLSGLFKGKFTKLFFFKELFNGGQVTSCSGLEYSFAHGFYNHVTSPSQITNEALTLRRIKNLNVRLKIFLLLSLPLTFEGLHIKVIDGRRHDNEGNDCHITTALL